VPAPKPKPDSALDEDDYLDLHRTQINLRHRMEIRREKNDLYKDILALKEKNKLLSAKPILELEGDPDV